MNISHEERNLIISVVFLIGGIIIGYNMGQLFLTNYIVPTISEFEKWGFMIAWCFTGLFCGWHGSKMFWCTCGI